MYGKLENILKDQLKEIREQGLYKEERLILSPQSAEIRVPQGDVLNFCANNYLGLADNAELIAAAKKSLDERGFGMSSVRFICGTTDLHKKLEQEIARFLKMDDTILYSSCFDANGGLFETLLGEQDAIISDELNHASIIDGIRLCKAQRYRYKNSDMKDLEAKLQEAKDKGARLKMVATDGVFSMDGTIAKLDAICDLAEKYEALVMVDDSHATGFIGKTGRGTPEHCGVEGRIDVMTSTLGKALGGATGGFTTGKKEIIEYLRQRSRPYLFSNTVAPVVVAASLKVFELLEKSTTLRDRLEENTQYFRAKIKKIGFKILEGTHPIIPVMLGDAKLAQNMAKDLLDEDIYVIGFSYPVVPKDKARIRVQISAAHTRAHLDQALQAFEKIGEKYRIF
ncbi:MAG: glycine C-acetyltransferase [Deltaproteobacteria bacterium]|nr:glycine C-acetyltransferase [Deltaproteobacteria bacterium]